MVKITSSSQPARRAPSRQRPRRHGLPAILTLALGALLMGVSWYLIVRPGSTQAGFTYSPADVVYAQPLHASHETGPSSVNPITFPPKDGPQPKILVLEDFHNFGSIGPGKVVTHDFVIANQGEAPLIISRAYTTCGCTTADFSATVIPPGKVSLITLRLDAGFHDVSGQTVRRGVIIENNDPKNPQVELWVQASVRARP